MVVPRWSACGCAGKRRLPPRRSWRTNGPRSHQRKGKMLLQRRTARCSSSASAGRCVPAGLDGRAPNYDDWTLERRPAVLERNPGLCAGAVQHGHRERGRAGTPAQHRGMQGTRAALPFHKMLLTDELSLTIGGGIGQSRLCMLLLGKAHVGEVQVSLWTVKRAPRAPQPVCSFDEPRKGVCPKGYL